MPSKLVECSKGGTKGWKAEGGGECYIGPGAREKARAQMTAINISTGRRKGASWAKALSEKK